MNMLNLFKGWKGESGLTEKGIKGTTILGNIANIGLQKLGNGNQSGVGNLISTIGGVIPGPWGVAAQGAGHLINAAFGSNIDEGAVENYMSDISRIGNAEYNAGDYRSLLQQKRALGDVNIDRDILGTQGWLSSKLDNTYADLNNQLLAAENQNRLAFNMQAEDINQDVLDSAYSNIMKKGGRIHIKKENRGKFTKYCGGKVTAECIARGKRSSSPTIRKRATFAANARKWHHSLGGNLFYDGGLMFQHGGIFSNGITTINNGGTHEQNPFEGVQMGIDNQGIPNMVEEGEIIWNDYVFSNRLQPTEEFKKKYKVKGKTFADVAKELQKESEERPNDPISKNGLEDSMTKLMMEQENIRQKNNSKSSNKFANGSWLRYAPVVGSALGATSDLFGITNKPDYSNVNLIQDATNRFTPIDYTPIGTYLSYNPFDKNFYSSRLAEQAGATRRAITNQAINPGAAMSGLLAADYNAQTQLGGLFRQAEEYNQAQRERVAGFNRQTDAMNSEMAMKAAMANQKGDELRLKSAMAQAQMREDIDSRASAARSANLTNLFDNLGSVGKEKFMMDMIEKNPALLYTFMGEYKGGNTEACGGKINRRRRK